VAERTERIPLEAGWLDADLALPDAPTPPDGAPARGLVVFAHGSGSGRRSPRNREVAEVLRRRGLGTLLVDLLTAEEAARDARTAELRFDIGLLGDRVCAVLDWLALQRDLRDLRLGVFGASTGAAAALIAAARKPEQVAAVVSRGGRPDLAGDVLADVRAPTLLIVGADDPQVLALNRDAQQRFVAASQLELIAGAGHLFEEPGAMAQVAALAGDWFALHLA